MRAIVITYTIKSDRWEDATSSLRSVVESIGGFPGLQSWANTANRETGNGNAMAIFENSEAAQEAIPHFNKVVKGLGAYMTATPHVEIGELLAQINN